MTELERCEAAKSKGFTYCAITGNLRGVQGNVITRKHREGYIACHLYIDKKQYKLYGHRLAWYLHHGELPVNSIDHIDGNTSNNKIDNLRDVTHQHNHFNQTTAKGYTWHKQHKKFHAQIRINGKPIHLGYFISEPEARNAYLTAKEKYHPIPSA